MWQRNALPSCITARGARYEFLGNNDRRRVLNVALICTAIVSLSLATIIALCMAALRLREIFMGRGAA